MKFAIILFSFILSIGTLRAAPIDFIDKGSYTVDKISGLDWYDVTNTVNMSKKQVLTQLEAGGTLAGWRYATGLEFVTLMDNYTNDTNNRDIFPNTYITNEINLGIINLLGSTFTDETYWETYGLLDNAYIKNGDLYYYIAIIGASTKRDYFFDETIAFDIEPEAHNEFMGSYLVRDSLELIQTPIPATIWLMGTGLIGLLGFGRKNKVVAS